MTAIRCVLAFCPATEGVSRETSEEQGEAEAEAEGQAEGEARLSEELLMSADRMECLRLALGQRYDNVKALTPEEAQQAIEVADMLYAWACQEMPAGPVMIEGYIRNASDYMGYDA